MTRVNDKGDLGMWKGDGGNPALKPWKADAVDLSYEYYFGNKGYVSVAASTRTSRPISTSRS